MITTIKPEDIGTYNEPKLEIFLRLANELNKPFIVRMKSFDGRYYYAVDEHSTVEFITSAALFSLPEAQNLTKQIAGNARPVNRISQPDRRTAEVVMLKIP